VELTRRVRTSFGEIAFDVFGDGPPVVLVHGTPSRALVWRRVVPVLAAGHRVAVFDLLASATRSAAWTSSSV
jgi:pimeloyl-ACP methyl ester carboxylesterase